MAVRASAAGDRLGSSPPFGVVPLQGGFLLHTTTDNATGATTVSIEKFFVTCF